MHFLRTYGTPILAIVLILTAVYSYSLYAKLTDARATAVARDAEFAKTLAVHNETLTALDARIRELEALLGETKTILEETIEEKDELAEDFDREKDRNEAFEDQIDKIGSTVGTLDKLAKTDKELLQKYSKVYFLNEHYTPPKLTEIPAELVYTEGGDPEFLHAQAFPFFKKMVAAALEDGVKLWVVSAFRSFDEQRALKGAYTVTYGSGANTFSADQGYSEHQLGTTIDLTTEGIGGGLTNFETTQAYAWLEKNAHTYGFVLSYPKGNAYYVFEPWHWRFVGTDLARDLHKKGKSFYDMDQREIDEYLISLFD